MTGKDLNPKFLSIKTVLSIENAIWKEMEQNLKKGQTLDNDLQKTINREANKRGKI